MKNYHIYIINEMKRRRVMSLLKIKKKLVFIFKWGSIFPMWNYYKCVLWKISSISMRNSPDGYRGLFFHLLLRQIWKTGKNKYENRARKSLFELNVSLFIFVTESSLMYQLFALRNCSTIFQHSLWIASENI